MYERKGTSVTEDDVSILLTRDAEVYRPDGQPLCVLRKRAIPDEELLRAYEPLHSLSKRTPTDNRGSYGGGKRQQARDRQDGRVSNQNRTVTEDGYIAGVRSSVIGYYPRQPRIPFCRETSFTANEVARWMECQPMVQTVSRLFEETLPERYCKQASVSAATSQAFVIQGTPFTTMTVNSTVIASIHQDKLDFKDGFGVISVIRRGTYRGHWLVFPQFCVGVDLEDGDVLFFNSHDWHGNTAREDLSENVERISVVYYYRTDMQMCGTPEDERLRADKDGMHNWNESIADE